MRKLMLTFDIYTDGDFGYDTNLFKNYTSNYLANEMYEYTDISDYVLKCRRVFDYSEENIDKLIELLESFKNSLYGKDYVVNEFSHRLDETIGYLHKIKETGPDNKRYPYFGEVFDVKYDKTSPFYKILSQFDIIYIDSDAEIDGYIKILDTDVKKIKQVIYED